MQSPRKSVVEIKTFTLLVKYLRDELDWPIDTDDFEEITFDYTPQELGINKKDSAKIRKIQRLRSLTKSQPWGVFFVDFESKALSVVGLRRLLNALIIKKRDSSRGNEHQRWDTDDLLFISSYGEEDHRQLTLAHFSSERAVNGLPALKVLGWDDLDTELKIQSVVATLHESLCWPSATETEDQWRDRWASAFTLANREVIDTSRGLATKLADVARAIRQRVNHILEIESGTGPLSDLKQSFTETLVGELSLDDFADMIAQTLSYGALSTRISQIRYSELPFHGNSGALFGNPFLRELVATFESSEGFDIGIDSEELGIVSLNELLDQANMPEVLKDFGNRNPDEDPVIHFYELFLKEYDSKKRVERGVFYTPRPVVEYIINEVDTALEQQFGLEHGIADATTWREYQTKYSDVVLPEGVDPDSPLISILDPATGTGTFLVEVIDRVFKRFTAQHKGQCTDQEFQQKWNSYVKESLLERLVGYELLMAPYAIAHMKVGLKLLETGVELDGDSVVRIYLTNSLEPPHDTENQLEGINSALAHEVLAVGKVKRDVKTTVVVGNPPYSNFGGLNKIPSIMTLLEDYKRDLNERKINLDDDFIKFIRFAQNSIEQSGLGIVGFISNNVFLNGLTHRQMRKSILGTFNNVQLLDLHGNVAAKERAPDGGPDENVFEIKQGVSIEIFAKTPFSTRRTTVGDLQGTREAKYRRLRSGDVTYIEIEPQEPALLLSSQSANDHLEYVNFWSLPDVFIDYAYGIQTKRDALTIAFSSQAAIANAKFVLEHSDDEVREEFKLPADGRDWEVAKARKDLARLNSLEEHVTRVLYRPFDWRFTIYTDRTKGFIGYPRWQTMKSMLHENFGIVAMRQIFQQVDLVSHIGVSGTLIDERTFYSNRGGTYLFPLFRESLDQNQLFTDDEGRKSNLSPEFLSDLLTQIELKETPDTAIQVFDYLLAVGSSVSYRRRYHDGLRVDYPRFPIPATQQLFLTLSELGASLRATQTQQNTFETNGNYVFVTGESRVINKASFANEQVSIDSSNPNSSRVEGVTDDIWNYQLGGYRVCEKWLKDRKGRLLTDSDAEDYLNVLRAIEETLRVTSKIDSAIESRGGWPEAFVIQR